MDSLTVLAISGAVFVAAIGGAWVVILLLSFICGGRVDRGLDDAGDTKPLPDITGYAPDRAA